MFSFSAQKTSPPKWLQILKLRLPLILASLGFIGLAGWGILSFLQLRSAQSQQQQLALTLSQLETEKGLTEAQLQEIQAELDRVTAEDQFKKNQQLETEMNNIRTTYRSAVSSYEAMLKLKETAGKNQTLESLFAKVLTFLANQNYASGSAQLTLLNAKVQQFQQEAATAAAAAIPASTQVIKEAPNSGYRRQAVESGVGTFLVDVIAADLNSTRVVVETASAGDCGDNCPTASLADFVGRAGGFAGVNGPYFCPAEYPSCAGKTNSFDTLLMNKNKVYFNSANNVYSTVPAVIFSGSSARFVGHSSEWGRDTGVDSVIAAQPMTLSGGNVAFGGDGDPKKGSRGNRSFIGARGSTVFIGVVHGATVAEVGHVLKAMGLENALNLDSGGSTALINNGKYVAGPGRQTPFGIVLVRK
jgi:hypothetical protein